MHMAQLTPLPLTVSCFSKIQIGFTFLVPAFPGSPGKRAVERVCVCGVTTAVQASTVELKHRVQSNICHSLAASITSTLPGFQLTTVDFADSSPDSARWNSFVRHLLVKNGFSSKCCSKRYTHHTSHAKTTDNNSTEPHNRQQNTPELYEGRSKSFATSYLG